MAKRRRTILLLIVILALALRCWRLDNPFLTTDESFSWRVATYSTWQMVFRVADDVHGPLHFVLLKAAIGLFGSSLWVMRGLSVLFGVATVPMVYLVVRDALALRCCTSSPDMGEAVTARLQNDTAVYGSPDDRSKGNLVADCGALLSAALVACNALQIDMARSARMYSLGGFLAVLTAWLLLRALRSKGSLRWWLLYGLAAAGFCYTHYFAFFTILAQGLAVAGYVTFHIRWSARRRPSAQNSFSGHGGRREAPDAAQGFLAASGLALALYSPWLPVLIWQTRQVHQQFWISALTADEVARVFFAWSTGLDGYSTAACATWMAILAIVVIYSTFRAGSVAWFFLVQAAVPWVCCIGLSVLSGQSIFQERYLSFAQLALIVFWGVTVTVLPNRLACNVSVAPDGCEKSGGRVPAIRDYFAATARVSLVALVTTGTVVGLFRQSDEMFPAAPHAGELAMRHVKDEYRQGDLILVSRPADVNRTRYYADRLGIAPIDVRCYQSAFPREGHSVHVASLSARDVIWSGEPAGAAPRVWTLVFEDGRGAAPIPTTVKRVTQFKFTGSNGSTSILTLFERRTAP